MPLAVVDLIASITTLPTIRTRIIAATQLQAMIILLTSAFLSSGLSVFVILIARIIVTAITNNPTSPANPPTIKLNQFWTSPSRLSKAF